MESKRILGVKIDDLTLEEAKNKAAGFFSGEGQYKIFTPNPEMLVKARKDLWFKEVLNKGDINLCDGFGLSLFSGAKKITGVDFMLELCKMAAGQGRSIYLLGSGSDEVAKKAAEELQKQFPSLKISGFDKGPEIKENFQFPISNFQSINNLSIKQFSISSLEIEPVLNEATIDKINVAHPDILFVAFGMGKQEKWIEENLSKMPSVKIAMGVGGAFDYVSGFVSRAPCWMRKIGLEWAYRLFRQPRRFFRIVNAVVLFSVLAIKEKL